MIKQYFTVVFLLCFFIWALVVDNAVLPSSKNLKQEAGEYSRYRVKKWNGNSRFNPMRDQIMIYAVVKNRELVYYIDYKPHFEIVLKSMAPGTPVLLRFDQGFPKIWKRHLYQVRTTDFHVIGYSSAHLAEKQKANWTFSATVGGAFIFLIMLGLINNRRVR